MISNNTEQGNTSKKRQREKDDVTIPNEELERDRMVKLDTNETISTLTPSSVLNNIGLKDSNMKKEIDSYVYRNDSRLNYFDFLWKVEIPKTKFEEAFMIQEKLSGRDDIEYNMGISNVVYPGTLSSSLIFMFQNGQGLNDDSFKEDMCVIANNFAYENEHEGEEAQNSNEARDSRIEADKDMTLSSGETQSSQSNGNSVDSQQTITTKQTNDSVQGRNNTWNSMRRLKNTQGKYFFKQEDSDKETENDEYIVTYDIFLTINIVNHKMNNFQFRNVQNGQIILAEAQLNTLFFSTLQEEAIIIFELTAKKNYNYAVNFTGIINEAMTCYMNSMLQSLNVLGYFKRAVFNIPFEGSDTVAYSLQRLFYDLSNEEEPISTNKLIQSFGWSRDDIFIQHDVQEFFLLLSDLMEKKMKGTKSEEAFKVLFEGKILNYIRCLDVDFNSSKEESICDIQLTVKGCKDIYDSLNKYTEEEILDNEDKYLAEGHGKQRAKKGIKFLSIPPVAIFQLKRFEYNPRKDQMDKINDCFKYYEEIDLSSYLPESSEDQRYSLHSVVVHKGNINNGHYMAYIRPTLENKWFLFNDEIVREADKHEVFDNNYGGSIKLNKHRDRGVIAEVNSKSDGNAYILIYLKNSMREMLLKPLTKEEIPKEISMTIEKEKQEEKRLEELRIRQTKYMNIYLIGRESLLNYKGPGISPCSVEITPQENLHSDDKFLTHINVPKDLLVIELLYFLSLKTRIPIKNLILFTYTLNYPRSIVDRHHYHMRHIDEKYYKEEVSDLLTIIGENSKYQLGSLYIYVDVKLNQRLSIFSLNDTQEQDGEEVVTLQPTENKKTNIYIPYSNKYKFSSNMEVDETVRDEPYVESHTESEGVRTNYKLLLVKCMHFSNQTFTLSLDKILLLNLDHEIPNYDRIIREELSKINYRQFIENDHLKHKEYDIDYYLELTSGEYEDERNKSITNSQENISQNIITDKEEEMKTEADVNENKTLNDYQFEFITKIKNFDTLLNHNDKTDSLIIILNPVLKKNSQLQTNQNFEFENLIEKYLGNMINLVYLPVVYSNSNDNQTLLLFKENFILTENPEATRKRLFEYLLSYQKLNDLIKGNETKEIYVLDTNQQITHIDEVAVNLTYHNLHVYSPKTKLSAEDITSERPLLNYIFKRQGHFHIEFSIETMTPELFRDHYTHDIFVYDADNNPLAKLILHLPDEVERISEILDYIYPSLYDKFYKHLNVGTGKTYQRENIYIILQHPYCGFAYEILLEGTTKIGEYSKYNMPIDFRIQPYEDQIDLTTSKKLFISFQNRDGTPTCDPMILLIENNTTVIKVKNTVLEKLKKMTAITSNQSIDISLKNVKFYTYRLINYKPLKETLLLCNKDEEPLLNFFKNDTPCNLLVEFIPVDQASTSYNNQNNQLSLI